MLCEEWVWGDGHVQTYIYLRSGMIYDGIYGDGGGGWSDGRHEIEQRNED